MRVTFAALALAAFVLPAGAEIIDRDGPEFAQCTASTVTIEQELEQYVLRNPVFAGWAAKMLIYGQRLVEAVQCGIISKDTARALLAGVVDMTDVENLCNNWANSKAHNRYELMAKWVQCLAALDRADAWFRERLLAIRPQTPCSPQ